MMISIEKIQSFEFSGGLSCTDVHLKIHPKIDTSNGMSTLTDLRDRIDEWIEERKKSEKVMAERAAAQEIRRVVRAINDRFGTDLEVTLG